MEEPKTQSVDDAARLLGIGRNQAYEAVRRGEIPAIRIGKRWLVLTEHATLMTWRDLTGTNPARD